MSLYLQICQSCLPVEDKNLPDDAAFMNLQAALQTAGFEARIEIDIEQQGRILISTAITRRAIAHGGQISIGRAPPHNTEIQT